MAVISFARGIPSPDLLPVADLADCMRAAAERFGGDAGNYGPAAGFPPLREWIAARHRVSPSRVVVTNGSLQGFALVAEHALAAGGEAVVEAPTYDRTLAALLRLHARVEAVPLRDDGLDLDALAELLGSRGRPRLLYTIPTFQNPTGRSLSLEQRRRLVELAADTGTLVYEDDPYRDVRFEGDPLPTLHELAAGDNVVFASSFSKIVAPGLRLGYLVLPEQLVGPVEALVLATYISPSSLVQAALLEFLEQGRLDAALGRIATALRARRDAMLAALARELPDGGSWSEPEGGYFVWLDLPPGVGANALVTRAMQQGVTFVPGTEFYAGAGGDEAARLAFSFASPAEIGEGIAALGGLVADVANARALPALPGTSTPARS